MEKTVKSCANCKHHQSATNFTSDICNLYNKYAVAARVRCQMDCWEKRPKEKKK